MKEIKLNITPERALEAINLLILFGRQEVIVGKFEGILSVMEEKLEEKYKPQLKQEEI